MSPNMSNHVMSMSEAPHVSSHSASMNHNSTGIDGGMGTLVFTSAGVISTSGALPGRHDEAGVALTGEIRDDDATMDLRSRCDADKANITYSRGRV